MEAGELLRAGRLSEALARLQDQVRSDPANSKHRVFLFQLLCVLGQWDRALTQLNLAAEMDPKCLLMSQVCQPAIQCEALRAEIYSGKRLPLIFGEPSEWVGWMVQAAMLTAGGKHAEAGQLRSKALEAAPAIAGNVDGRPFEWAADADPRMGPILEAVIEGKYFWIPMSNIRTVALEAPTDLRDVVWMPATFTWTNGGRSVGLIPTRYPGSEQSEDPAVRLARKTDWIDAGGVQLPVGQRLLATDAAEYPLMEVRQLTLGEAEPVSAPGPEGVHG